MQPFLEAFCVGARLTPECALHGRERPPQGRERVQGTGVCRAPGGDKRGNGRSLAPRRDLKDSMDLS